MAAGLQPTKTELDSAMGGLSRDIKINLRRAKEFKDYLDAKSDAELIALGYVQGDVDNIRSAFGDLNTLNSVFLGAATQASLKDFTAFVRRIWGTGGAY